MRYLILFIVLLSVTWVQVAHSSWIEKGWTRDNYAELHGTYVYLGMATKQLNGEKALGNGCISKDIAIGFGVERNSPLFVMAATAVCPANVSGALGCARAAASLCGGVGTSKIPISAYVDEKGVATLKFAD